MGTRTMMRSFDVHSGWLVLLVLAYALHVCMWYNQHLRHQLCFLFFVAWLRYSRGNLRLAFVENKRELAEQQQKTERK